MVEAKLITKSDFARLVGVSAAAVSNAIRRNKITTVDGMIDPDAARAEWAKNSRPRMNATGRSVGLVVDHKIERPAKIETVRPIDLPVERPVKREIVEPKKPVERAEKSDVGPGGNTDYWVSRAEREATEAAIAKLKLQEMQGSLMRVDAIKAVVGRAYAATREGVMQIPARVSFSLAAESDPSKIQATLDDALHKALDALSGAAQKLGAQE